MKFNLSRAELRPHRPDATLRLETCGASRVAHSNERSQILKQNRHPFVSEESSSDLLVSQFSQKKTKKQKKQKSPRKQARVPAGRDTLTLMLSL